MNRSGRPLTDALLIFKILVLQSLYVLADEPTEFLNRERLNSMRFLRLDLHRRVLDGRTICMPPETLLRVHTIERLFARYDAYLKVRVCPAIGGR